MKVEILGTGCHSCLKLDLLVGEVAASLGRDDIEIVHVDNEQKILHYMPLDAIPGLVIDGELVSEREVPSRATLEKWLTPA